VTIDDYDDDYDDVNNNNNNRSYCYFTEEFVSLGSCRKFRTKKRNHLPAEDVRITECSSRSYGASRVDKGDHEVNPNLTVNSVNIEVESPDDIKTVPSQAYHTIPYITRHHHHQF